MTRPRSATCRAQALAILGLLAWSAPPPVFAQAPLDFESQPQVRQMSVVGNVAYSDRKLYGLLRTRGPSRFRPWRRAPYRSDFIRFDRATLQAFYRRRGFLSAAVDSVAVTPVTGARARVDVRIYLTEGPQFKIESVRIVGAGPIAESELRKVIATVPGAAVDAPQIEADRQEVEDRYADAGYVEVQVADSLAVVGQRVGLIFDIAPGQVTRLGQVTIEGTHLTRKRFVERELLLKPGDLLSREKLAQSQQRIYDSGLYKDVQFERSAIDSASRVADLFVSVKERKLAWVDAGLGYGTVDQLRLTSEWGHRNLGRQGIRFSLSGRLGVRVGDRPFQPRLGDRRADIALSQPWFFRTRTQASVGGYAEEIPRIKQEDFPLRAYGVSFALRRDLSKYTRGFVSLEQRHVISDTVSLATQTTYTTRRVTLSAERDTRRDLFDPTNGSDLQVNVDVAGGVLRGSARFLKFSGQATTYRPVARRTTVALRLRAGYVRPFGTLPDSATKLEMIPVDDRFRTGGATTVRGYFENEIGIRYGSIAGGSFLLMGSAELRFPLVWLLSGAAFLDGGNVWERPEDVTLSRLFTLAGDNAHYVDMRYSVGGGIRFRTPVGPVRFDYGWKLRGAVEAEADRSSRRGTFHFSLGQAF